MANTIIVGAQWGDEGKGKIIDLLGEKTELIVRSQGGCNAGHTVINDGVKYIFHLIPSGILHAGKTCLIANGVVLDAVKIVKEIVELRAQGVDISPNNLLISKSAHLILPYHRFLDEWNEEQLGEKKIGTTLQGVGPAYSDKFARCGLRFSDLLNPELFGQKLATRLAILNPLYQVSGNDDERLNLEKIKEEYLAAGEFLRPFAIDSQPFLYQAIQQKRDILFEAAQGTFLDIDHGSYPYVTSSNTTSGGICTGSGVPPTCIDKVLGVVKAYTTRVGSGPFPTEDTGIAQRLHGMGREFGSTTGRPRRCGWLDIAMLNYATMLNGITELAITNLDGLDELEQIKLGTSYRAKGKQVIVPPGEIHEFSQCEPEYITMEGWREPTQTATSYKELPARARAYLEKIEELTGLKIRIVSVGPERAQSIIV